MMMEKRTSPAEVLWPVVKKRLGSAESLKPQVERIMSENFMNIIGGV
jgi:hypothetical protein